MGTADFNGDGHSDVPWRHDDTGTVYIFLMNGSSITFEGQIYQEPPTPTGGSSRGGLQR